MNITLSKVHFYKRLSQETNCFDALVCVDGRPVMHVMNEGQGGPNRYNGEYVKGISESEIQHHYKLIEEYAKQKYPEKYEGLDTLIDNLLERELQGKKLKSELKKKMLVTVQGSKSVYSYKAPYTTEFAARIRAKDATIDKILNELPFEKALDLFYCE